MSRYSVLAGALSLLCLVGCLGTHGRHEGDVLALALPSGPRDVAYSEAAGPAPAPGAAPREKDRGGRERLDVPAGLPGAGAPDLVLPERKPGNEAAREKAFARFYPPLPEVEGQSPGLPGPEGRPLTLADLQQLGLQNSPPLKQATAAVEEARGAALQAGLPPNPSVGFAADAVGQGGTAGSIGGFVEQVIRTGNKLKLARAVAAMDLRNAEVALRRAEVDLAVRIRRGYFNILVEQQRIAILQAVTQVTGAAYRTELDLLKQGGTVASYEPMQARVLALRAQGALIQAQRTLEAAWKQLAADLGLPDMPRTVLAGGLDLALPVYDQDALLRHVLEHHTDIHRAINTLHRAQLQVSLARVLRVPDATVRATIQKDRTSPPASTMASVEVGFDLPVWDRNQGGILEAEAALVRASQEVPGARASLSAQLASAYQRYSNSQTLLRLYREQILPGQVQAYRALYDRYRNEPPGPNTSPPNFSDIIVAQDTLVASLQEYLQALGGFWDAVTDLAALMQVDDLYLLARDRQCVSPLPDLHQVLLPLTEAAEKSDIQGVAAGAPPAAKAASSPAPAGEATPGQAAPAAEAGGPGPGEVGTSPPLSPPPPRQERPAPAPSADELLLTPPPPLHRGHEAPPAGMTDPG